MLYPYVNPDLHRLIVQDRQEALRRVARDSRLAREVRRTRRARRRAGPHR